MEHLKPGWFARVLSWIDFAIEVTLGLTIFILAALMVASLVETRVVENLLSNFLLKGG
jgi:hypothetical protein